MYLYAQTILEGGKFSCVKENSTNIFRLQIFVVKQKAKHVENVWEMEKEKSYRQKCVIKMIHQHL